MNDKLKETIAGRIEALLNKTVENGATEEEALMAMEKASELMAKYQMNMTEVQMAAEGLTKAEATFDTWIHEFFAFETMGAIGRLTEVKVWRSNSWDKKAPAKFVAYGLKSDVDYADYLLKTLTNFAVLDCARWWRLPENYIPVSKRVPQQATKLKTAFLHGFSLKVQNRIAELAKINKSRDEERKGKGLMVLGNAKKSMIDEALAKQGMKFRSSGGSQRNHAAHATNAGWNAGDKAGLSRGLDKGGQLRLK